MQRFSRSKSYKSKEGDRYSYEMKYRDFWQFYKISDKNGKGGGLRTFSEADLLKLELTAIN